MARVAFYSGEHNDLRDPKNILGDMTVIEKDTASFASCETVVAAVQRRRINWYCTVQLSTGVQVSTCTS